MSSIATENPDSTAAIHIRNNGEVVHPALTTTPTPDSWKPCDHTLLNKFGGLPVGTPADEDEAPSRALSSIRSPVDLVLGNFFLATLLISLIIFIVSFIVTWFTVLRDARSMNGLALSNATGVSLSVIVDGCCYYLLPR